MSERIQKVLANCEQGLSTAELAQIPTSWGGTGT
jgi:hypothetical protein